VSVRGYGIYIYVIIPERSLEIFEKVLADTPPRNGPVCLLGTSRLPLGG
jgi:hypothetical protein